MKLHRTAYLALVVLVLFGLPVFAQQQVMVTPDSYVENQSGEKITYDEFVAKMNTGQFIPMPLKNEDGEHIGFRLTPRNTETSKERAGGRSGNEIKLESSEITDQQNLQFIYRDYLFAKFDFFNGESWTSKWMVFDTGTFIPIILLPEVAEEIGSVQKVKLDKIEVIAPPVGSYEFNDLIRNLNRYRDRYPDEFGDIEIAGIAGLPILSNYLFSIHAQTGRVSLRPIDSEQRTLNTAPPIARVEYRSDLGNIWFPVTINGREGLAHLDTGNPYFDVDSVVFSNSGESINSLTIGETDMISYFDDVEFRTENMAPRYPGTGIDIIAAFGNRAVGQFIITIDPREQVLYFEKPR